MTQLKVFEFAKQIGVETLALMDKIREWQLPIKSHMATLDEAMMEEIQSRLQAARAAAEDAAKPKKKTVKKKTEAAAGTPAKAPPKKAAAGTAAKAPGKTAGTATKAKSAKGPKAAPKSSVILRR